MVFNVGASLAINPKDSLELIWGGATRVYNFLAKNDLHPATAVYIQNCAIFGGDSEGWHQSLSEYAAVRPLEGFSISDLNIGYPGANVLPDLVKTEYGTRWLGILAVVATIRNEEQGSINLYNFLRATAHSPTREFVLGFEACEKLWTLSREIFVASPYWAELLRITKACLYASDHVKVDDHVFPSTDPDFIHIIMTAAYDLWQLAQEEGRSSNRLWARGCHGCSQLIFYLTVVCGFHVTISSQSESFHLGGCSESSIVVVVELEDAEDHTWHTGYIIDGVTVDRAINKILLTTDAENAWLSSLKPSSMRSPSTYRVDRTAHSNKDSLFLFRSFKVIESQISEAQVSYQFSSWLADYLYQTIYYTRVYYSHSGVKDLSSWTGRFTYGLSREFFQRLNYATELFVPGIIQKEHMNRLAQLLDNPSEPESRCKPVSLAMDDTNMSNLCSCSSRPHRTWCDVTELDRACIETVVWLWLGAHVDTGLEALRDAGPFTYEKTWEYSELREIVEFDEDQNMELRWISHIEVMKVIASHISGPYQTAGEAGIIAKFIGGFIVGISGSEDIPFLEDQRQSFYIRPGIMELPERRITEVYQERYLEHEIPPEARNKYSGNLQSLSNDFAPTKLIHRVSHKRDRASINSYVLCKDRKEISIMPNIAIDVCSWIAHYYCLGPDQCARGQLSQKEIEGLQVHTTLGPQRFQQARSTQLLVTDSRYQTAISRLLVYPVHGDHLIQRAFVSGWGMSRRPGEKIKEGCVSVDGCVDCAIRQAIAAGRKKMLIY